MADNFNDKDKGELQEKLIKLSRVAKVVKGGRRFSFSALVTVGDMKGNVGLGFGKANEVTDAINKASQAAKKSMVNIQLTTKKTITQEMIGKFKSSNVIMRPATPGTGIIAGGAVRSIMEVAGVHDVLAKVVGSKNQINVSKATLNGLMRLKNPGKVAQLRGKALTDIFK